MSIIGRWSGGRRFARACATAPGTAFAHVMYARSRSATGA